MQVLDEQNSQMSSESDEQLVIAAHDCKFTYLCLHKRCLQQMLSCQQCIKVHMEKHAHFCLSIGEFKKSLKGEMPQLNQPQKSISYQLHQFFKIFGIGIDTLDRCLTEINQQYTEIKPDYPVIRNIFRIALDDRKCQEILQPLMTNCQYNTKSKQINFKDSPLIDPLQKIDIQHPIAQLILKINQELKKMIDRNRTILTFIDPQTQEIASPTSNHNPRSGGNQRTGGGASSAAAANDYNQQSDKINDPKFKKWETDNQDQANRKGKVQVIASNQNRQNDHHPNSANQSKNSFGDMPKNSAQDQPGKQQNQHSQPHDDRQTHQFGKNEDSAAANRRRFNLPDFSQSEENEPKKDRHQSGTDVSNRSSNSNGNGSNHLNTSAASTSSSSRTPNSQKIPHPQQPQRNVFQPPKSSYADNRNLFTQFSEAKDKQDKDNFFNNNGANGQKPQPVLPQTAQQGYPQPTTQRETFIPQKSLYPAPALQKDLHIPQASNPNDKVYTEDDKIKIVCKCLKSQNFDQMSRQYGINPVISREWRAQLKDNKIVQHYEQQYKNSTKTEQIRQSFNADSLQKKIKPNPESQQTNFYKDQQQISSNKRESDFASLINGKQYENQKSHKEKEKPENNQMYNLNKHFQEMNQKGSGGGGGNQQKNKHENNSQQMDNFFTDQSQPENNKGNDDDSQYDFLSQFNQLAKTKGSDKAANNKKKYDDYDNDEDEY